MRSGKSLLRKIARDYTNLALKESELQCISGHSIDCIIDLFKRGYDLISEEEFERYKRIANMNLKDDVDLKELEKFEFYLEGNTYLNDEVKIIKCNEKEDNFTGIKVYENGEEKSRITFEENSKIKEILI